MFNESQEEDFNVYHKLLIAEKEYGITLKDFIIFTLIVRCEKNLRNNLTYKKVGDVYMIEHVDEHVQSYVRIFCPTVTEKDFREALAKAAEAGFIEAY